MWANIVYVDVTPSNALNDGGVDPITISCEKGDGTSNPAISSGQLRLYQAANGKTTGNTITFSSAKTITSIVFTFADNMTADNGSFSTGTYNSSTSTWTGSTTSVTLTVTGTTGKTRIYITAMKVYYEDGTTSPVISLESSTVDVDAAEHDGSIEVTYSNFTDIIADVAFYESDGTTSATYNWVSAEINSTTNDLDYIIEENTSDAARTAYLKVYALDDESNEVYSDLITITQAKAIVNYTYTLATAVIPGRHYIITSGTNGAVKALGAQNGNYRDQVAVTAADGSITVSSDDGVSEILIQANEEKGYYTLFDVENSKYLYASSNSSNNLGIEETLDSKDNGIWSIEIASSGVATIKAKGSNSRNWIRYNSSSTRFSCYGESNTQADVYLFEKAGDAGSQTVSVSIASACTDGSKFYGTYSSPFGFVIPDGLTVEEIGIDNEGRLNVQAYAAGAKVPANTGVMISSLTAGIKTLTLAGGGTSKMGESNRLRSTGTGIEASTMEDADSDCKFYRLTMHNGSTIGFWWGAAEGAAFGLAANKAYLAVPNSLAREGFGFDETTGIENVNRETITNNRYYTLDGREVENPTKGIFIVNGKKVVIR